ncbi:MAG: hypothetical protein HQL97_04165 [Magnetococcales bacterium]|nr:hypothetical protein [Magnetococcales bacterium]MBF0261024.1 hypothetical protein [Magnetococcales bacterium]
MSGAREHWEGGLEPGRPLPPVIGEGDPDEALSCPLDGEEANVPPEVVLAPLSLDTVLTPEDLRRLLKIVSHTRRGLL